MVLEEILIAEENDSVEASATTPFEMGLTSSDLELHIGTGTSEGFTGIRFASVNVPAGATITDAKIQFEVDEIHPDVALTTVWEIEDEDDPPIYTSTDGDLEQRTPWTTTVNWVMPHWVVAGDRLAAQLSADFVVMVQHIVDRGGWNANQAMNFMCRSDIGSGLRTAISYDGANAGRPELIINYTTVSFKLEGDVRDLGLSTVGNVRCVLLKQDGAAEASRIYTIIDTVNANGSGLYSFTGIADNDPRYMVFAYNDDTNDLRGVTNDTLVPIVE